MAQVKPIESKPLVQSYLSWTGIAMILLAAAEWLLGAFGDGGILSGLLPAEWGPIVVAFIGAVVLLLRKFQSVGTPIKGLLFKQP